MLEAYCQQLYIDSDEHTRNGTKSDEQKSGILLGKNEQAVSNLRNNKASESDGVVAEILKLSGEKRARILW